MDIKCLLSKQIKMLNVYAYIAEMKEQNIYGQNISAFMVTLRHFLRVYDLRQFT